MRDPYTEQLKRWLRPGLFRLLHPHQPQYTCPICAYQGPFKDKRVQQPPGWLRQASKCPRCAATERHRLMYLVLEELFTRWDPSEKSLLHIAPEECLSQQLQGRFSRYHSADLYRKDVDFKEDIQCMSFGNGSYDCVILSRVLISPPDLEASVAECRRILRPGGLFVVAEYYPRAITAEYGEMRGDRSRELGVDAIDLYRRWFSQVELYDSDRYDARYQLFNRTWKDGVLVDDYPELVRAPGKGLKDLVALCWV